MPGLTEFKQELDKSNADLWPPEVRELISDRARAFVLHYVAHRQGAAAARAAGFGTPDSTAETFAKIAYQQLCREDVADSIAALSRRQVRSLAGHAVQAIKETLEQPFSSQRMKAAAMVLDRTDNVTTKISVDHQHHFDPIKITLDEIVRLQSANASKIEIMRALGLESDFEFQHYQKLLADRRGEEPITAEYRELPAPETERDPDADLLGE